MNLLPQASGSRPRLACEISPDAVVAARATEPGEPLEAVARVSLVEGAVMPNLRPGNIIDRVAVVAALRRALDSLGARPNSRGADLTLIIPDNAVRVLLLDFDTLPGKLSEALPLVRFRLKKLVPFETDDAMVSFQVMSSARNAVRVLAVAIPPDVLSEYESAVREAGYEPGAVLPSTLAVLSAISGTEPVLLANASRAGITTAIVREGILLLHRSIDLQPQAAGESPILPAAMQETAYSEPAPVSRSPYNSPTLSADLNAELHNAVLVAPTSLGSLTDPALVGRVPELARAALSQPSAAAETYASSPNEEIAQAISVAVAYYEDTLSSPPSTILSAGPLGADGLRRILYDSGAPEGLQVRELIDGSQLAAGVSSPSIPRSTLAGVVGALRG